jgi:hypothetical protein
MAKLYPIRLPEHVLGDPRRQAEKKIFEVLSELGSSFCVFYNVAWQVRDLKSGARDGEADFIIAHPELGLMILEVKGGQIRYDANQKQWFSKDRQGIEHEIKDPIEQARNSKGALLSKFKELPGWDQRFLTIAYLAVFPDVVVKQTHLRPDLPRQLVLDSRDLSSIEKNIKAGFEWYFGEEKMRGALGVDRLPLLEGFFGQSFTLRTPLGVELANEEQRLIELTADQMKILHFIQSHRRALIEGCAGSGKTMLALEKARHLGDQGFDTLLLFFNAPLAEYLHQRTSDDVSVFHFHGLCNHLAKEAGIGYRAHRTEEEYFNKVLPNMLLDAIDELGPQYDAIVVDEGQDFRDEWWEILFFLLRDQQQGIFYIFYDSNQNIYHRPASLTQVISAEPFTLWENCRNTRAIHNIVKGFHHDPKLLSCRGPVGRAPEIFYSSTSHEQEEWVKKVLHRLVNEEKVEPSNIVLLTTRSPEKTSFAPGRKFGNFVLMEWGDLNLRKNDIRVSSAHRFKGLESRVIILTGLEDNDPSWLNPLLYVACSRARTHLAVVAHERTHPQLENIFRSLTRQS